MITITRAFTYHDADGRRVNVLTGPAPDDLPDGMADRLVDHGWAVREKAKAKDKGTSDAAE